MKNMRMTMDFKRRVVCLASLWAWLLLCLAVSGCAPTQQQLTERAQRIAQPSGLQAQVVASQGYNVMTYARVDDPHQPLRVYLEGDGKAWITRTRISMNPTPHNPVALRLAALDDAPNVVYIARPCQYVALSREVHCSPHDWSLARYSPAILDAIDGVISQFRAQVDPAAGVELVGYSGGGALAALLATKRDDIRSLRTVAANLDTELFTRLHQVSPLDRSLNPADFSDLLASLPQRHYVGMQDDIIPQAIAQSYRRQMATLACTTIAPVNGVAHADGWERVWPGLLQESVGCQ